MTEFISRILPPHLTARIQSWMILGGLVGMIAAPFLPTGIAVIVINEASMLALVITGMAGLDSARNPPRDK